MRRRAPRSLSARVWRLKYALELAAGMVDRYGLRVGHVLRVC